MHGVSPYSISPQCCQAVAAGTLGFVGSSTPLCLGSRAPFLLYHLRASVATKTTAWVLVSTRFPTNRLQEDLQTPYSMSIRGHSLNQLHLDCFSKSLEGVPTYAEHLLAAYPSLCGLTHPKLSQLGWGRGIVQARSSDAALHHSPYWSNSPYTALRCVGALCCCKSNDSLTKRKPDIMTYRCRMLW
jgi:hypothetical protein